MRNLVADAVEVGEAELHLRLARDRQEVQDHVRRAAEGHRERDRARARAEVDRDRLGIRCGAQRVDRELRDHLGLGSRNEDPRPDPQLEVAERRETREVLQRLPRRAAGHELLDATSGLRRLGVAVGGTILADHRPTKRRARRSTDTAAGEARTER